jgi:hypothetical protein
MFAFTDPTGPQRFPRWQGVPPLVFWGCHCKRKINDVSHFIDAENAGRLHHRRITPDATFSGNDRKHSVHIIADAFYGKGSDRPPTLLGLVADLLQTSASLLTSGLTRAATSSRLHG